MKPSDILSLRIPVDLRKRLQAIADEQTRSLTNLIIHILTKYLEGKKA